MKDEYVPTAKPISWTSLYFGVGGGFGSANTEISGELGAFANASLDGLGGEGGFFTFQVGADYQVSSRFVVGAFFDYDVVDYSTDLDININIGGGASLSESLEFEDMWTIGGRVGYLVSPSTLFYVGAGYSEISAEAIGTDLGEFSGYSLLTGIEAKFNENFSIKAEYRYTQFDSEEVLDAGFATVDLEPSIHAGRVVAAYRFNLLSGR